MKVPWRRPEELPEQDWPKVIDESRVGRRVLSSVRRKELNRGQVVKRVLVTVHAYAGDGGQYWTVAPSGYLLLIPAGAIKSVEPDTARQPKLPGR